MEDKKHAEGHFNHRFKKWGIGWTEMSFAEGRERIIESVYRREETAREGRAAAEGERRKAGRAVRETG